MDDPHRQLFVRFRDEGDVAALGALFDQLAVELFRLALYLAPNASDAEDIVQGTFLTAMESANGYDDARPLRPWLTGILANLARRRRRERHLAGRCEVPDGLDVPVDGGAAGAAERAEFRASFREAMRGLPQPYRHVLTLHLDEGMTARRIGEVLERPAGTVRSQVVRGLELLRKAIPAGVAGGLAATLTAGHSLAGVRVEVLRRAESSGPSASAGNTLGEGTGRLATYCVVTAAAALVAVIAWAWWPVSSGQAPASAAFGASGHAAMQSHEVQSHQVLPFSDTPERAAHERSRAAGTPARVELRLRLVDRAGAPQAGITCRVVAAGGPTELFAVTCARDESASLKSDADGWIRFEGRGSGTFVAWIVGSDTRRRLELPDAAAAAGLVWPIPDVRVVAGRVRTPDGSALARIDVLASTTAGIGECAVPVARSGDDGRFSFPLAGARTYVWAAGAGFSSAAVAVRKDDAEVEVVAARTPGAVDVAVLDSRGAPVAGSIVAGFPLASAGTLPPPVFVIADDRGIARLDGLPIGDLVVVARDGDASSERTRLTVGAGAAPFVSLRLTAGAEVEGRVVDDALAPVRGCRVYAQVPPLGADSFDGRLYDRVAWTDDDGRYLLTGLPRGDVRLRLVHWREDRELCCESLRLGVGERRLLDWRVRERQLRGRVVGLSDADAWTVTVAPIDPSGRVLGTYRFAESVNSDGTFEVLVPPRFGAVAAYVARARGPAPLVFYHARAVVRDLAEPIEIVVEPSAQRCATVLATFVDDRDRGARVELLRSGAYVSKTVGDRGKVTFAGVAVGDYTLRVARADGFVWTRGVQVRSDGPDVDLDDLAAGEEGMLVVEAKGALTLQLRDARDCLVRDVPATEAVALEAGEYVLRVSGVDAVPQTVRIAIEAGRETRRVLEPRQGASCSFELSFDAIDNTLDIHAELRVAVFDAAGGLVAEGRIARPESAVYRWTQKLASGLYRVEAAAAWGGAASGTLVVDGASPVTFGRHLLLP